jgi:hypothetical protein
VSTGKTPGARVVKAVANTRLDLSGRSAGPGVPDFTGMSMREVLKAARAAGLEAEFVGSGVAASQRPKAGERRPADKVVTVRFR